MLDKTRERPAPLATTVKYSISGFDITRAHIFGDQQTQERIEIYGEHNDDFLADPAAGQPETRRSHHKAFKTPTDKIVI